MVTTDGVHQTAYLHPQKPKYFELQEAELHTGWYLEASCPVPIPEADFFCSIFEMHQPEGRKKGSWILALEQWVARLLGNACELTKITPLALFPQPTFVLAATSSSTHW